MRLIDADALKAKIRDTAAEGTIADYCKRVMAECLDNDAPTIDAIPVEWLRGLMNILVTGDALEQGQALLMSNVIEAWQEEQEART